MENRHVHICRFYEKISTQFIPNEVEVKGLLQSLFSKNLDENVFVRTFLYKLKKIQTKKHIIIGSAVTTVAYKWNYDGTIHYGASRFVKNHSKDFFQKKGLRLTAIKRLEKKPIMVHIDPDLLQRRSREKEIRRCIHRYGCFSL